MMEPGAPSLPPYRFRPIRFEQVASTQDEARALARSGAVTGTLVIADRQTSGRGRGGRSWDSPGGLGLWLTLIHRSRRPVREWPLLTSAGALGVCMAIEESGLSPSVRWPNDVLVSGRKVCGVLAETEADALLLGIGVNVLQTLPDFPSDLRGIATSLAIEMSREGRPRPDREGVLDMILRHLASLLDVFESGRSDEIVTRIWGMSVLRGRRVEIFANDPARLITGEAIGLNDIGGLVVRGPSGAVEIVSGEVRSIDPEVQ